MPAPGVRPKETKINLMDCICLCSEVEVYSICTNRTDRLRIDMICQTLLTQAKVKNILSPINDMQFSDRIRIENGLFHLYGPYGST